MKDLNKLWVELHNKVYEHNILLAEHKDKVHMYSEASGDILKGNFDEFNSNETTFDKGKDVDISALELDIKNLRNKQEQIYEEIKEIVKEFYYNTNYLYSDLEKLFRQNQAGIYLVADKIDKSKLVEGTQLLNKDNEETEYRVDVIVTNSPVYYLEQLGVECTEDNINDPTQKEIITETVHDNLEKLALCGNIVVTNEEAVQTVFTKMVMTGNEIDELNEY